jgi:uncharacterized membrane protein
MTSTLSTPIPPGNGAGAARGLQWWSSAIAWLFGDIAQLGVWVLMALVFFVVTVMLHFVPLLGSIASFLLHFVFSGGLLVAASKSSRGVAPPFADLFAGFGPRAGQLIALALLVFVACLAVFALMMAVGFTAALSVIASGLLNNLTLPDPAAWGIGLGSLGLLALCLLALVPISMAAWLAPALVMLRGTAPVEALRLSLAACSRNMGALTVYGLVGIFFAIVATLLLGLGWLVLLPLALLSTYAAFQDLFPEAVEVVG